MLSELAISPQPQPRTLACRSSESPLNAEQSQACASREAPSDATTRHLAACLALHCRRAICGHQSMDLQRTDGESLPPLHSPRICSEWNALQRAHWLPTASQIKTPARNSGPSPTCSCLDTTGRARLRLDEACMACSRALACGASVVLVCRCAASSPPPDWYGPISLGFCVRVGEVCPMMAPLAFPCFACALNQRLV
jgi:hypothetical protein